MAIGYNYIRWISFPARPYSLYAGYGVDRRDLYTLLILLYILAVVMKRFSYRDIAVFDFRGHLLWNKPASME